MKKILSTIVIAIIISLTAKGRSKTAEISGKLNFLNDGDTVMLVIPKYAGLENFDPLNTKIRSIVKDHQFHLQTMLSECKSFYLDFVGKENADISFILSPGDNIFISGEKMNYHYTGTNAVSLNIQSLIRKKQQELESRLPYGIQPENFLEFCTAEDSITKTLLIMLNNDSDLLSQELVGSLRSEYIYGDKRFRAEHFNRNYGVSNDSVKKVYEKSDIISALHNGIKQEDDLKDKDKVSVVSYTDWIYRQYRDDSCLIKNEKFSFHKCFVYYKCKFSGQVREELITKLFLSHAHSTQEDIRDDMRDAMSFFKNSDLRHIMQTIADTNITGAKAYDFSLTGLRGETVKLDSFKGKVVVLDFWFTGCGACRELAPELFKVEQKYEGKNVVFISISVDKSKAQWIASVRNSIYSSSLAINVFTAGQGSGHPVIKGFDVKGYPTLVVIDQRGKIGISPDALGAAGALQLDKIIRKYLLI